MEGKWMNNLVFIENNQAVTDSLTVAEVFGKEHKNVLRDIRIQIDYVGEEFAQRNFAPGTYQDKNNQARPKINMTEEAFTLIAMSYNTKEAVQMKVKFLQEFKRMREEIQKRIEQPKTQAEMLLIYAQQFVDQERKLKILEMETINHSSRIEQIENKIEKRMTDDFEMQLVTPTQIGKMFEPALSGKKVNILLQKAGYQWRVGGEWVATVEGKKYSSSEPVQLPDGKMTYQLKWQRRVKDLIQSEVLV
jgi:Rha family phage regulatory protein